LVRVEREFLLLTVRELAAKAASIAA